MVSLTEHELGDGLDERDHPRRPDPQDDGAGCDDAAMSKRVLEPEEGVHVGERQMKAGVVAEE